MPIRKSIVNDTLLWVEKHIENAIDINQVTEISGYCRRQIQTVFKLYTGENLGCYIRCRRLSRASMLLRLTNLRIGDIAQRMGFDSPQSFNRAFKKHFGCTPLQFRNARDWDFSKYRVASSYKPWSLRLRGYNSRDMLFKKDVLYRFRCDVSGAEAVRNQRE